MSELTVPDHDRLVELEAVVDAGLQTFVDVGQALLEIRDGRLYRATHATFDDYCRERWSMNRDVADRTIRSAAVVEALRPTGRTPANERQARELVPLLDEPEVLTEAWREAINVSDGKPTATVVAGTVKRHRITDDDRARILALHADGKTGQQIAETIGCSQSGVSNVIRAAADQKSLPKRRQAASDQTRALAKLHGACREWEKAGDEEYIPAPELARRIRVLEQALTFVTRKRAHYYGRKEKGDQ